MDHATAERLRVATENERPEIEARRSVTVAPNFSGTTFVGGSILRPVSFESLETQRREDIEHWMRRFEEAHGWNNTLPPVAQIESLTPRTDQMIETIQQMRRDGRSGVSFMWSRAHLEEFTREISLGARAFPIVFYGCDVRIHHVNNDNKRIEVSERRR